MRWTLIVLLAIAGCKKDKADDTGDTDTHTGDDSGDDTGDTNLPCTVTVTGTEPEPDAVDVYYKGIVEVTFDGDAVAAEADIDVLDGSGYPVLQDVAWSDGNLVAYVRPELQPNSAYELVARVCDTTTSVRFQTGPLGEPLTDGNASLVDRTYVFTLADAKITEPAFLDALAGQYLTVPLLFNVTAADDTTIDFLGALGYFDPSDSQYYQVDLPTWDFPAGDFTESPYFTAQADYITIMYDTIPIPIEGFYLEGVFTADGASILEGRATGKGDTRHMAPLINQPEDAYSAVCEFAALAGVYCEDCADGEPYCLYIVAEDIQAAYVPGLSVVEIAE